MKVAAIVIWAVTLHECFLVGAQQENEECYRPVPFGVNRNQLSASSFRGQFPPQDGLINDNLLAAWCAAEKDTKQWLQIDLHESNEPMAIALQGLYQHSWVESFYLQYSTDGETWYCYGSERGHKLFSGNENDNTVRVYVFNLDKICAQYVRINPRSWQHDLCLRIEVYGCPCHQNETYEVRPPMYNNTCGLVEPTEPPTTATLAPTTTIEEKKIVTPILPFELLLPSATIKTGDTFRIGVSLHEGTGVLYHWNLGNRELTITKKNFPHVYQSPGVYDINVNATNANNSYANSGTVVVQDHIAGLECVLDAFALMPMEEVLIKWVIHTGTNVTFTLSTGDGDPDRVQHSPADYYREFSLTHQYQSVGVYNILISAKNDVDEKHTGCNLAVEDPVTDLSVMVTPTRIKTGSQVMFITVGESITIRGKITGGTNVSCTFDFGEGVVRKGIGAYQATHNYTQTGNYSVGLTCKNQVSSAHSHFNNRIVVQKDEPISNLEIVVNVTRKDDQTAFMLSKSTGTAFVCNWTLGDGTAFQTDISDIFPIYHQYSEEGPYDVCVKCIDRYRTVEANSVAWVQIPLTDLTCESLQRYVKTAEEAFFNISIHSGSHAIVSVKFEDDKNQTMPLKEGFTVRKVFILKHLFQSGGFYHVKVTASNRLDSLTTKCKPVVVAQNPLRDISLIPDKSVIKVADEVTFNLKTSVSEQFLPTNVSCSWSFGEGKEVHRKQLIFNSHRVYAIRHRYLFKGSFATNVSCSNKVSRISLDTNITVLEPINPVIKVCLHCDHSTNIMEITSRQYFALGENATFLVTSQDFDKGYQWTITSHGDLEVTEKPYFSKVLTEAGKFTVTVTVDKVVENLSTSVEFIVQERISGVLFASSGFTWLRSATRFKLTIPKFQFGICYVISFNESFKSIKDCASRNSANLELSINRTFLHEGTYNVCMHVFNNVSEVRDCEVVQVVKPVCKLENISIWNSNGQLSGNIEDTVREIRYHKSKEFKLEGNFSNNCLLPNSQGSKEFWQIWRISTESTALESGNVETNDLVSNRDGSVVVVFSRYLEYGKYNFVFSAELTSPDVQNLYGRVAGKAELKVEIVRSPIAGNITGAKFLEVDIEEKLRLDASFYDPDKRKVFGQTDMKFEWYCKTRDQPNGSFVHCLEQGKSFDRFPIAILTSAVFTTSLDRYVANKAYIFSVRVTIVSDGRSAWDEVTVFILPPGPPKMKISCTDHDCSKNIQPPIDLRLEAICESQCVSFQLSFRWELLSWNGSQWSGINISADLNMEATNRAFTIRSYIFQKILRPGGECLVRLEVRREGGRAAYLTKIIRVNEAPKTGNCSTDPRTGELSNTEFRIFCDGWSDPDTPLRYSFSYGDDEKPVLASLDNPTSSRKFRIYKQVPEEITSISIQIKVVAEDALGMSSEMQLYLKIKNAKRAPVDLDAALNDLDSDNENSTVDISNPDEARAETQKVVNLLDQLLLDVENDDDGGSHQSEASANSGGSTTGQTGGNPSNVNSGTTSGQSGDGQLKVNSGTDTGQSGSNQVQSGNTTAIPNTLAPTRPPLSPEQIKRARIIEKSISKLNAITKVLANSETTTVSELMVISDAVVRVTENNEVLTQNARENSIELISSIVDAVDKANVPISNLEKMALMIVKAIENLLRSISAGSPVSLDDPTYRCDEEVIERGKEASKQLLQIMNKMFTAVLKAKSPGDADTVINTTLITAILQKTLANTLNDSLLGSELGLFRLPKLGLFQDGKFEDDAVSLQMVAFDGNPYDDCEGGSNVTTPVVALEMQQSDGAKVTLSGLQNDVDIRIRQPEIPFDTDDKNFYLTFNGTSSQFHIFNHSLENVAVGVEFFCEDDKVEEWTLMVAHERRPSAQGNIASWSVNSNEIKLFLIESSLLIKDGTYHVLVQGKPRGFPGKDQAFNSSYILKIWTLRCFFWNETTERWSSAGCRVGLGTSVREVQCLCNHLTSFAAQVFVAPNAIDFDKALSGFLELTSSSSNQIVLSTVISTFCIYLLLLIWARRIDVRNAKKAETIPLEDNDPLHHYKYEILVLTGMRKDAGTTADVCCDLVGLDGDSGLRLLRDPNMLRFQRSSMDAFLLTTRYHLGELTMLKIWHNNTGSSPSWYLKQVVVRDLSEDSVYVFMCNRWLAVEFDDGQVLRKLPLARQDELKSFNHLFHNVTQNSITDNHLWFSVFVRPEMSSFTTVQRLSCCLTLLYCAMLTNAMFYQLDENEPDPTVILNLGPMSISLRQLYLGIISGVIVFPLNIAIASLFRNASNPKEQNGTKGKQQLSKNKKPQKRAKAYKGDFKDIVEWYRAQDIDGDELTTENVAVGLPPVETVNNKEKTTEWLNRSLDSFGSGSLFTGLDENEWEESESNLQVSEECNVEVQINEKFGSGSGGSAKEKKQRLPHWFVYVGWSGIGVISLVSAFFVTLYGFEFGDEKAMHWLISLLISFIQDVLISQPIKVLLLALVVAILIKKPQEQVSAVDFQRNTYDDNDDNIDFDNDRERQFPEFEKCLYRRYNHYPPIKIEPPDLTELANAREKRTREIRMSQILKEIVIYVLFLIALFMVSFGQRDPKAFLVAKLLEDTYLGGVYTGQQLNQADGISNYWKWIEGTLLPSLSSSSRDWAAGCHPLQQYTVDCNSRLVGGARVRQLRIKPEACQVAEPMKETVSACNDYYSVFKEDKSDYTAGWISANKTSNVTSSAWYYQSMSELDGLPFLGVMATYGGGGYSFESKSSNLTETYLNSLKDNSWIDARTRAIFVEIAIYSAQVNLFGVATFLTEWIPTNGVVFFNNIKVARLYRYGNDFDTVMQVCEIFLVAFFVIFLYTEMKQMYKLRKDYFKDPWNWLEISQIILILAGAAALLQRTFFTQRAIDRMKANPEQFISFIQATTWDEIFGYLLAFLVFFANLKLLKLMRFNHRIYLFTKTISTAATPLLSFLVVFFIFYIAYSILFYSLFGPLLEEYRSFLSTIKTLFNTVMGAFDFEIIRQNNRLLGPIIFFSFMMIMVMILMNVFLTILMDSYAEVQEDENLKSTDAEVVEYMLNQLKQLFARTGKVGNSSEEDTPETLDNIPDETGWNCPESETSTYKSPDENSLEGSQQQLLRTGRTAPGSFSSIANVLDSTQKKHGENDSEGNSPTWPSLLSLRNHEIDNSKETMHHPEDQAQSHIREDTSCILATSVDGHGEFPARGSSTVYHTDDKTCGSDSGVYSPYTEHSQDCGCFAVRKPLSDFRSMESNSGYFSSFSGTESSAHRSEQSVESEVSHYYNLLDRAIDISCSGEGGPCAFPAIKSENNFVDPDLSHYYQLLDKAAREEDREGKAILNTEKFDFTDYQVCHNNIGGNKPPRAEEIKGESSLEVEPKLDDLLGNFANVAISDIQEDQIFEQLFILYVTALNEVSFEPDCASMDSRLFKRFEEKAKWKYTRHMYTQA